MTSVPDTASWMAMYRALESERADAAFRDPYARALAGDRGPQIAEALPFGDDTAWLFTTRTWLVDRYVGRLVKAGADTVLNLAAGLDARPYRLQLPPSLRWIEADAPEVLEYKSAVLSSVTPTCRVEHVALDVTNVDARRGVFARIGRDAQDVVVLAEGLVVYLMRRDVCDLGRDLASVPSFRHWIVDLVSPGLLDMMKERMGAVVQQAGAPFLFGPPEGPAFFESCGWKAEQVGSILQAARRLNRVPLSMRMFAMLPESSGAQGARPWSAVCVLAQG